MLVKNNEARIHNLGDIVTLVPGVNDVPEEAWKKAQEIFLVRHFLQAKVFEEVHDAHGAPINKVEPGTGLVDINTVPKGQALEIVGTTFDRTLLTSWRSSAKDSDVTKAIESQLERIAITPEEKAGTANPPSEADDTVLRPHASKTTAKSKG